MVSRAAGVARTPADGPAELRPPSAAATRPKLEPRLAELGPTAGSSYKHCCHSPEGLLSPAFFQAFQSRGHCSAPPRPCSNASTLRRTAASNGLPAPSAAVPFFSGDLNADDEAFAHSRCTSDAAREAVGGANSSDSFARAATGIRAAGADAEAGAASGSGALEVNAFEGFSLSGGAVEEEEAAEPAPPRCNPSGATGGASTPGPRPPRNRSAARALRANCQITSGLSDVPPARGARLPAATAPLLPLAVAGGAGSAALLRTEAAFHRGLPIFGASEGVSMTSKQSPH